jgi:thiopeptide-type bacteriocin biosynthesis protein
VARHRRERRLRWFLFIRKPPDVRIRVLGPDPEADLAPELRRVLAGLRRAGHVTRFFRSVYEPETRQFGGPEAMAHVHAYFDTDTAAWIALDRLAERGLRTVTPEVWHVAVLNDLFYQTLGDRSEVWDVWANLFTVLGAPEGPPDARATELVFPSGLPAAAGAGEGRVLRRYEVANRRLAGGLRRVWSRGRLGCGLRALLPFVALVHFNRHGVDGERQAPLVRSMMAAWSPRRRLVGAEVTLGPVSRGPARSHPRLA